MSRRVSLVMARGEHHEKIVIDDDARRRFKKTLEEVIGKMASERWAGFSTQMFGFGDASCWPISIP